MEAVTITRETKETQISVTIGCSGKKEVNIDTGVGFFDHMLSALFFHGGFDATIKATGDLNVEPHHLVEDVGIVVGKVLNKIFCANKQIKRFSSFFIPMDDALARCVVDFSGRAYLVYKADYPQQRCGEFDVALIKEFFYALTVNACLNLHIESLYGENSHHIAEAIFKSAGKAIGEALKTNSDGILSTKGAL